MNQAHNILSINLAKLLLVVGIVVSVVVVNNTTP
jgi:hypothetical protein